MDIFHRHFRNRLLPEHHNRYIRRQHAKGCTHGYSKRAFIVSGQNNSGVRLAAKTVERHAFHQRENRVANLEAEICHGIQRYLRPDMSAPDINLHFSQA